MKTPVTKIYEFYQAMGKISEPEKVFFESMLKEERDNMIYFGDKVREIDHHEYDLTGNVLSNVTTVFSFEPEPLFNQMFEQR